MFSATFPESVAKLAKKILKDPVQITIGGKTVVAMEVDQIIEVIEKDDKYTRLLQLLGLYSEKGSILVFVDTQEKCDNVKMK